MAAYNALATLILCCHLSPVAGEDYISSIMCASGYMKIQLNDDSTMANETYRSNDTTIEGIMVSEDNEYQNYRAVNCTALIARSNSTRSPPFKLYYYACNKTVIQPEGGDGYIAIQLIGKPINSSSKLPLPPRYTFQAHCVYNSHVTKDCGANVTVPSSGGSGGDHGGSSGSDIIGLSARWSFTPSGKSVGDKIISVDGQTQVDFVIEYTKKTYDAILPVNCYISNHRYNTSDPQLQSIPFVYGGCPAYYGSTFTAHWIANKLLVQQMLPVKFHNSDLLYGHCELQLCAHASECPIPDCFTNDTASSSFVDLGGKEIITSDAKSSGHVYSVLAVSNGGGGSGNKVGGNTARIVGATLGSVLGLLVIAGVILGASFLGRRKTTVEPEAAATQPDPAFANSWWMFYKIPRAKTPESVPATLY